ncbi:MAG: hypothetical protein JRH10_14980 [Deltaproteobacteria bacterium]|nr:hypothetical protein [Deltaproteobacteria bacterium]
MPHRNLRPGNHRFARLAAVIALVAGTLGPSAARALDPELWRDPPKQYRPVARWWWPGGAVDEAGIRAELMRIEAAGFGAVEVQPLLLGMSEADLAADPRIRSVGSEAFARHVGVAARVAAELGLAFDLTVGSGWPGGLPGHEGAAERQLLVAAVDLDGASDDAITLPSPVEPGYVADVQRFLDTMGAFDTRVRLEAVLAVRLVEDGSPARFDRVEVLTDRVRGPGAPGDLVDWEVPKGRWRLLTFWENRTGHSVLGGAYPGDAYDALTVDHLSAEGAGALWSGYIEPLLAAAPPGSVRSVFVDSFELIGELPWTPAFREAFITRKGYDPTPHLPLLFRKGGESKYSDMVDLFGRNGGPLYLGPGGEAERARIREDYEEVREALFVEDFLGTLKALAERRNIALRLQAHGGFADYLDAYAVADIPESEALFAGGSTDFLKLASSAAHVAGRRVASSESFITLRFYGHQLGVPELHLLAGRAFAAGINQIVHHGVPYRYTRSDGRGWYPFSGGFGRILAGPLPMSTWFRDELWDALPRFNRFLARLSYAMQQGEHAADVAWLRAEGEFPDAPSFQVGRVDPREGESLGARALRERGLVHDRVSRRQLRSARVENGELRIGAARYRALILDPMDVARPEVAEHAFEAARAGVPVFALGSLPTRTPGKEDSEARRAAAAATLAKLREAARRVDGEAALGKALRARGLEGPLLPIGDEPLRFSIDARQTANEHIVLVVNESWSIIRQTLRLNAGEGRASLWDPQTGTRRDLRTARTNGAFELTLGPTESVLLTVGR